MRGDPDPDTFRRQAQAVIDWIADYLRHTRRYPVASRVRPGEVRARLPRDGPEEGEPWEAILADFESIVLPGVTHWNHPRFFGYFAITGSAPGILAEALTAALNVNAMAWHTSPAATELEQQVLRWLAAWLGLPEGLFGMITDTASISSLYALAAAREAVPGLEARRRGLGGRPDAPRLRLYASEQAHSSIDKAAIVLGIGHEGVRRVPTDGAYRMEVGALEAAVAEDRAAGWLPFCVVATAGTTSTTSVDPMAGIAGLCRREGLWLHVDAAYAGAAALVPELRPLFDGWERADSVVVNPHKWLFTPLDCSALYTRRPELLREAFALVPEYLRGEGEGAVDPMDYGLQLGRRFRALKLWFVFRAFGRRGLEARIRHHVELARRLAGWIDEDPDFERLAPTPFSTVCFRYRPGCGGGTGDGTDLGPVGEDPWAGANDELLRAVNRDGGAYLSSTRLRGRVALRLAIGNLRTEAGDVEAAWELIRREATRLPAG